MHVITPSVLEGKGRHPDTAPAPAGHRLGMPSPSDRGSVGKQLDVGKDCRRCRTWTPSQSRIKCQENYSSRCSLSRTCSAAPFWRSTGNQTRPAVIQLAEVHAIMVLFARSEAPRVASRRGHGRGMPSPPPTVGTAGPDTRAKEIPEGVHAARINRGPRHTETINVMTINRKGGMRDGHAHRPARTPVLREDPLAGDSS